MLDKKRSIQTNAVHYSKEFGDKGSLNVPIYQNSTFGQETPGVWESFTYSRTNNPTEDALRQTIAGLENASHAVMFSSGMAAINGVTELFSNGDHVVSMSDIYGGTHRLFNQLHAKKGLQFTFVDTADLTNVKGAVKDSTKMIYLETPSNPLLEISDIKALSKLAKENGCLLVVDNTLATPCFQQPITLGADIVIHSTSKYISGHTNVIGGVAVVNDLELYEKLHFIRKSTGANPGPFDCYLTMLGIKTLPLRMKQHESTARAVADFLDSHSKVSAVHFPGLEHHPQYELAKQQMTGLSGIVSLEIDGDDAAARTFIDSLELFSIAVSFGSVASLLDYPAKMSHKDIPEKERGFSDSLVRLSLGIESEDDLLGDIQNALSKI